MPEKVSFSHKIISDWGSGFTGELIITNLTTESITNWELSFEWNIKINEFYNCKIKSHQSDKYAIEPLWNKVIGPNTSAKFGFQGAPGNISTSPNNYKLICDEFSTNLPLANLSILEYSRKKLGKMTGTTKCIVGFKSDQDLIAWEARANGGTGAGIGLLVGTGNKLLANQIGKFDVNTEELTLGDKEYIIKVYGKNQAGEWST